MKEAGRFHSRAFDGAHEQSSIQLDTFTTATAKRVVVAPTSKQLVALRYLYQAWRRDYDAPAIRALGRIYGEVYPAALGYAVCPERKNGHSLRPQGAGRVGGNIGSKLVRLGWAYHTNRGYRINDEGIRVLELSESLNPMG